MKKFVLLASAVTCVNQGIAADKLPVNKDMFFGCDSLPILFDDMSGYLCHDKSDIHKINFKGVETSAPGEMTFSEVETARVKPDIRSMFEGCGKLETIVCKTVGKFHVCENFTLQKISDSDTSKFTDGYV